jgi:hypothetical protein
MLRPEDVQTLRDRSYVHRLLGNVGAALHDIEVAITFAPNDPRLEQDRQYTMSLLQAEEHPVASPPTLYIQVADKAMTPRLNSLIQALKRNNVNVPPVQVVGAVPNRTQLRYAGPNDETKASDFVKALDTLGIKADPAALNPGTGAPNRFELWVGKNDNPLLQIPQVH